MNYPTGSSDVVRDVLSNYRVVTGIVKSPYHPGITFEGTLERDFAELLDFSPRVRKIQSQPLSLHYPFRGETRRYTPDFRVTYCDHRGEESRRQVLYEVKYLNELRDLRDELAPRFAAARTVCAELGWSFRVVTERYIRTPYLENVKFLRDFRTRTETGEHGVMLLERLATLRVSDPGELLAATFASKDRRMEGVAILWKLVANRLIRCDLRQKLTMNSTLWVDNFEP